MKLPEKPLTREYENLLPLVNVVFLLLIFFMVTSTFTSPEPFEIQPILSETNDNADMKTLTILMDSSGKLAVENEVMSKEAVVLLVQKYIQNDSLKKVQLKSDANAEALEVIELLESLASTDLKALHILSSKQP